MGIIMRNNIAYSGGGGSETVELSMAEYEAREAAGAIDSDTWYLIYDANDSYNAKKIVYDNAESGMEASTVQGAIDELNSNLVLYSETLVARDVVSKTKTTTTTDVPFDGTNKQIHSLEVNSTGWSGVIPQGIYYNETTKNIVVTCYSINTMDVTSNLSVVVRYSLK